MSITNTKGIDLNSKDREKFMKSHLSSSLMSLLLATVSWSLPSFKTIQKFI